MSDSILTSIKKLLGVPEEYEHFDMDLVMHINSTFMILTQLGVGKPEGFMITDKSQTWADFIREEDMVKFNGVKSYIYMKVKLLFDPPQNSFTIESCNKFINELEWRLNTNAESGVNTEPEQLET